MGRSTSKNCTTRCSSVSVPDFMFVVVVKQFDTLAFFPVQELLIDTDAAIPAVLGGQEVQDGQPDNTVGWPAMDRDIVCPAKKIENQASGTASRNITEL